MAWFQDRIKRCHAKSKRTGEKCKAPAVKGKNVCYKHGGAPGSGRPPSSFRYVTKENIWQKIEEARLDPDLLEIKRDIAIVKALLDELISRVDEVDFLGEKEEKILIDLACTHSALVEKFYKVEKERAETFNLKQLGIFISYVSTVVRRYIPDPEARKEIARELESIPFDTMTDDSKNLGGKARQE